MELTLHRRGFGPLNSVRYYGIDNKGEQVLSVNLHYIGRDFTIINIDPNHRRYRLTANWNKDRDGKLSEFIEYLLAELAYSVLNTGALTRELDK